MFLNESIRASQKPKIISEEILVTAVRTSTKLALSNGEWQQSHLFSGSNIYDHILPLKTPAEQLSKEYILFAKKVSGIL